MHKLRRHSKHKRCQRQPFNLHNVKLPTPTQLLRSCVAALYLLPLLRGEARTSTLCVD